MKKIMLIVFIIFIFFGIFTSKIILSQNFKTEPVFSISEDLDIVSISPKGNVKMQNIKEITIVFNQPMIEISKREELEKQNNYMPFIIKPAIKGNIHWYGTQTVAYEITDNLIPGQKYQIYIPNTIESINKKKLKKEKVIDFTIEKFQITSIYPKQEALLDLDSTINISHNFPLENIQNFVSIFINGKELSLNKDYKISTYEYESNDSNNQDYFSFHIEFNKYLPPGVEIQVKISKNAKIKNTKTIIGKDYIYKFKTKDAVFVELINEARFFQDYYSLRLEFSDPIDLEDNLDFILILDKQGKSVSLKENLKLENPERYFYLSNWKIKPGERYAIVVKKGLKDIFGTTLKETKTFQLETPILRPNFFYKEGDYFYESCLLPKQNFYYSNIREISLKTYKLNLSNLFKNNFKNLIFNQQKIKITDSQTEEGFKTIDFTGFLQKNNNCYYGWLGIELEGKYFNSSDNTYQDKSYKQTIQFTNIGLTILQSPERIWYFAQSLSQGNFLQDLKIQLYSDNKIIENCKTDSYGFCEIKTKTKNLNLASLGEFQQDKILLKHNYNNVIYHFGIDEDIDIPKILGFIVFDRKLYRTGETVFFKAYLHYSKNGKYYSINPNNTKFRVIISNSRGEEIYNKILMTNSYGTIQDSLTLPKDAPTGFYNIEISPALFLNQNLNLNSIYSNFQVEEFRPLTFTATISKIKDQYLYKIPEFSIEAKYLFGAPLSGAKVELNLSYQSISNSFKENYFTRGFYDYEYYTSELLLREIVNLNAFGKYEFLEKEFKTKDRIFKYLKDFKKENNKIIQLKWEELNLKEDYKIDLKAKIFDLSNRSITKFVSFYIYPSKEVPAIQLSKWISPTNEEFSFSIGNFDLETKDFATNSSNLDLYIFKEEWNIIATKAGTDKIEKEKVYTPILKYKENISVEKTKKISFIPKESGSYLIIVKNQKGSYAGSRFYISGTDYGYWNEEQDNLKLVSDKSQYEIDQNAKILIKSPYEKATALITIEGEDLYEQKIIQNITSSYAFDLKMKKEYYPGIYVSVIIFKSRDKNTNISFYSKDPGKPQIKVGNIYLEFTKKSKIIPLTIEHNCNFCKPRDKVKIKIQTEPKAEIALSIADRSVLDLIDYHYPEAVGIMYPKRSHSIKIFDNRLTLLNQFLELTKGDEGGGGDTESSGGFDIDGDDGARKNFKFTAYWNPSIIADEKGIAEVEFTLPDNTSTFRIMAMATLDGKFAKEEKEFIVQKELVIVPVLPNFIRVGEKIEIGGLFVNNSYINQEISAEFEANPKICLENKKNIALNSMNTSSLLWECEYKAGLYKNKKNTSKSYVEDVEFILSAKSSQFSDKIKQKVPVIIQTYRETFTNSSYIQSEKEEKVSLPDPEKNPGFIMLNLSSSIISNYKDSLTYFEINPYLCLEQRASAFYIHTLANKNNLKKEVYGIYEYRKAKELFLGEIKNFVNQDGGLKLWKESTTSNVYLTLYILEILYRLNEDNFISINDEPYSTIVKSAFSYSQKQLSFTNSYTEFFYIETLFYYFYVANLYNKDIKNEFIKSIKKFSSNKFSFRTKGYILLLLEKFNINSELKNKFLEEFNNSLRFTTRKIYIIENIPYFSSQQSFYTNISSLIPWLEYFINKNYNIDLIYKIIQGLISRNIYYSSSFEESKLAYVIDLYKTKYEKQEKTTVELFFENLKIKDFDFKKDYQEFSEKFIFSDYKNLKKILIKNQNPNTTLYYSLSLDYQLSYDELEPVNEGFYISKELFFYDELSKNYKKLETKNKTLNLQNGQVYLVRLYVTNLKPIQNFIIEDPISSLTEIVNLSFITENLPKEDQNENYTFDFYQDYYSTEIYKDRYLIRGEYLSSGFHIFEFYIRPISKGSGIYLPTYAKAIYEPEIYGRSDSYKIIVK